MPRPTVAHAREDGLVPVLLNLRHELVQVGLDWADTMQREHALGVLRAGGQVLRMPRRVVRQLRIWDRVEILQIGVTQPDRTTGQQISIPQAGDHVGSPHD